jgi:hypothetical protein
MSNVELIEATVTAARDERRATANLLALLAEVDARRLYRGEGCSSLFTYCTQVLRLSEHAAYHRIEAARAARRYPVILELVARGDVTLTTVAMLRSHLTVENYETVLEAARHKSKRDVEHQIACLAPRPATQALIRRMAEGKSEADVGRGVIAAGGASAEVKQPPGKARPDGSDLVSAPLFRPPTAPVSAPTRPTVTPLASDRYLLRITLSASGHAALRRAQDLMRHAVPNGDLAQIVERALVVLVEQLERTKTAKTSKPRQTSPTRTERAGRSRHIPAQVRRAVWARDEGQCAYVGPNGRCVETGHLEYHHEIPFARGGPTDVGNIALRCRAHNVFESELVFGRWEPPSDQPTRSGPSE